MNLLVTISRGKVQVMTASITDAEVFDKLKVWAESEGLKVRAKRTSFSDESEDKSAG
jgi:hypothetical protein